MMISLKDPEVRKDLLVLSIFLVLTHIFLRELRLRERLKSLKDSMK